MTEGFVLSDALVAVAAVSMACTLTAAALGVIANGEARIREAYETSEQQYEEALAEIGECVCTEQEKIETDTSLNSF